MYNLYKCTTVKLNYIQFIFITLNYKHLFKLHLNLKVNIKIVYIIYEYMIYTVNVNVCKNLQCI